MNKTIQMIQFGLLRAPDEEPAGGGGGGEQDGVGLAAGLDAFIEENEVVTATASSTEEATSAGESGATDNKYLDGPIVEGEGLPSDDGAEEDDFGLPEIGAQGKAEEQPPEEPAFDEDAFDAETAKEMVGLDPNKGAAWKALKEKVKGFEKEGAITPALQAELDALKTENLTLRETADQIDAMWEKVTSVTSRNAELLLEENDDYREKVLDPHNEIKSTVSALAEAKGVSEDEIWSAIGEKDAVSRMTAIDNLEKRIGARYALAIDKMSTDIRVIAKFDQSMRADAENIVNAAKMADMGASTQDTEARAAVFDAATQNSFQRYSKKVPGFTDSTGHMTDRAKSAEAKARLVDSNALSEGDLGYMAFSVQALPAALSQIKAMESEIRDLRVAAGDRARGIVSGSTVKKGEVDPHINPATGEPTTFMEGILHQHFES